MKILITGATGLLGSHLIEQGLELGHEFYALYRAIPKISYLAQIETHKNLQLIKGDVLEASSLDDIEDLDAVIHCAAFASPFPKDAEKMQKIDVDGTKALYDWAVRNKVQRFVHISSIACLGSQDFSRPVHEASTETLRDTVYAKSKRECDIWLDQQKKLPLLVIHPCYLLGKWDAKPSSGSIFVAL